MKKIFCLLFVVSGLLFGQQKPFAYWHSAWSNTPQLPANFIADANAATDDILIDATIFYRTPIDFDSILVVAKVGSAPANRHDGIQLYKGIDTAAVQNDVFTDASFVNESLVYASIYLRSTDGNWSGAKTDTAFFGTVTELNTPSGFDITVNNSTGTHILDATTFDVNADSVLVWLQTDDNFLFAYQRGYIEDTVVYAVADFPLSFSNKYYKEVWKYKIAVKNETDTSDWSALDSAWVTAAVGDTIYYAASSSGTGSGNSEANAKGFDSLNLSADINAGVVGRVIKLKRGDAFNVFNVPIITGNGEIRGTSSSPCVIEDWGAGAAPILSRTVAGNHRIIDLVSTPHINHFQLRNLDIRGMIYVQGSFGDSLANFRIYDCTIGSSTRRGQVIWWADELNVQDRDSVHRMYVGDHVFARNYIQNARADGNTQDNGDAHTGNGTRSFFYRNVITGTSGEGIDHQWGDSCIIDFNIISDCDANGIKFMGQRDRTWGAKIRGNVVTRGDRGASGQAILYLRSGRNVEISNNTFNGGIGVGEELSSSWVDYLGKGTNDYIVNVGGINKANWLGGLNFYNNIVSQNNSTDASTTNYWHEYFNTTLEYEVGGTESIVVYAGIDSGKSWFRDADYFGTSLMWFQSGAGYPYDGTVQIRKGAGGTSTYTTGPSWDHSGWTQTFHSEDATTYFTGAPDLILTLAPRFADSVWTSGTNVGDFSLLEGSPALDVGLRPSTRYDIAGNLIQDRATWNLGAYQNTICNVTDHFTYTALPYENNDFLIQTNGTKTISVTGHSAVTNYTNVILSILKNNSPFMADTVLLSYNACDSATFVLSVDVPADTALYTFRFSRDGSVLDTVSGIRIGNAYLVSGQSNASQDVTGFNDSTLAAIGESRWYETSLFGGIVNATEGSWDYGYQGTSWSILADSLIKKQGIPVLVINGAQGGTSITSHLGGDALYTNLLARVEAVRQHINGWTDTYWIQAETEGVATIENYPTYFDSLVGLWVNNMGVTNVNAVQLGMHNCLSLGDRTFEMQRTLGDNANATSMSIAGFSGMISGDGCHFFWDGYRDIGTWLYRQEIYGASYNNPTVDSIRYTEADSTIRVYFDQNITYTDSSSHNDYWSVDGDLQRVASASASTNVISLVLEDSPADVDYLGYLNRSTYIGGGLYRGKFVRNANRVSAMLFDSMAVNATGSAPVLTLPSNFTATQISGKDTVQLNATIFYRTVNFDSIRVNASAGSYPANQWAGTTFYAGTDTAAIQNDKFFNADLDSTETWNFALWIRNVNGTWSTTSKQDTAYFPGTAGGGGSSIAEVKFENNTETGTDGFTTVVKTPHTSGTQSSVVSQGTYAWEITGSGSSTNDVYGNLTFADQGTVTLTFDMWLPYNWNIPVSSYEGSTIARIYGNGNELAVLSIQDAIFEGGGYRMMISGSSLTGNNDLDSNVTGIVFANIFNQWCSMEIQWVKSATVGGVVFKIDGVTVYSELDKNTSAYTANELRIGLWNNDVNLRNVSTRFDNIILDAP